MEGEGKGVGSGFVGALEAKKDRQRSAISSVQLFSGKGPVDHGTNVPN